MRLPLSLLLAATALAGCAAPDRQYREDARVADCRLQQATPAPGYNLLGGGSGHCERVLQAQRSAARTREAALTSTQSAQQRSSFEREGPVRSASLSSLQARGQVFAPEVTPVATPVESGREVSLATGKAAVLPSLFTPLDSPQPHSGFAIGGRLVNSPDPASSNEVEGAELQFQYLH